MSSIPADFDIVSVTSEDAAYTAENLAEGRKKGWLVEAGTKFAKLEVKFQSLIHLNSVRVTNQEVPVSVVIYAQGVTKERGSYMGGAPQQASQPH